MPGNPDDLRRTYVAFCSGAGLSHADVKSLLADRGYTLSNNAVREFGRANRFRDERPRTQARGSMITIEILRDLISAPSGMTGLTLPSPKVILHNRQRKDA